MNPPLSSEQLQKVFGPHPHGVVGVVDELLALCREQSLKLTWADGMCRVRSLGPAHARAPAIITRGGGSDFAVPLPKSVFRAILARLAALCNEGKSDSVSPYGGAGEMALAGNPSSAFHVAFTNTTAEQEAVVRYRGEIDPTAPVTSPGSA